MTTQNKLQWSELLESAISEPGKIHEAYTRFHGYSLGNQFAAVFQCVARGIDLGPIATFNRWKELGRNVKKGSKAISLCMPATGKKTSTDESGVETENTFQFFIWKNNWFVLSQTEGADYVPAELPEWKESSALTALGIEKVPFSHTNGNTQGYAMQGRKISVSPIAALPCKTLFHEMAHIMLGHTEESVMSDSEMTPRDVREVEAESVAMLCCASLDLPGIEYSRGYIQSWCDHMPISEKSAAKIFATADKILKAGRTPLGDNLK